MKKKKERKKKEEEKMQFRNKTANYRWSFLNYLHFEISMHVLNADAAKLVDVLSPVNHVGLYIRANC